MAEDLQSNAWHATRLAPDWKALLDGATSEREIVQLTKEYLATWTPRELFALPTPCRPGAIKSGEDVSGCAFELARAHCGEGNDLELAELILKMMTFFSHASERLSHILAAEKQAAEKQAGAKLAAEAPPAA